MKLLLASALILSSAILPAATFDFESAAATQFSGGYTSLTLVDDGITMDVTRFNQAVFDVFDITPFEPGNTYPPTWGQKALSPFSDPTQPWLFDFDTALSAFSVDAGDYGQDVDGINVSAYSGPGGTGAFLGSVDTQGYAGSLNDDNFITVGLSAPGIRSIIVRGNSDTDGFPDSLYLDNVQVAAVPEPASMAVLGLGLAVLKRRRRSSR